VAEDHPVGLVGIIGGEWFGSDADRAVHEATILAGSPRHLGRVEGCNAKRVDLTGDIGAFLDQVSMWQSEGEKVCLLVSGDPGFFGLVRLASARLGPGALEVHPAPSSVALAAARAGTNWDDAVVISAHGRPIEPAIEAVLHDEKVAILCSPDNPPQSLGLRLLAADCGPRSVTVASRLGEVDEAVWTGDIAGLAVGVFDPLSVVLVIAPGPVDDEIGWRWGRPESAFRHRDGMITKAEVRAAALGKLGLLPVGVLWDVGAGSGSVAMECTRLAPGLRIFAVEQNAEQVALLRRNLGGSSVTVVEGKAPAAFEGLPDPDRAFVGGGGLDVLDAVLHRLRPGGNLVATYASIDRAVAAASRLGNMVQIAVSRAVPIGTEGALRLAAENPVFVCWGPGDMP
jgi:precorrin-6Y C5,15-methyltransferase (decarboxylating)